MLADAYPARQIEVVNCGVTAINSFVVREFVEEVVEHEPDLVLIYTGHNEFVGPYGAATPFVRLSGNWYFIQLQMFLQRTKTYYLLDSLLHYVAAALRPAAPAESFGVHLVQREIYLEDEAHRQTEAHYQRNMAEIVEVLREREVPVALCTLVSNLAGFYPLRSPGLVPPDAVPADYPQHAALHFDAGLAHQAAGDSAQALAAFVRARDLDGIHLRACSPFNRAIRALAAESGAILIDVEQAFAAHAPAGLVGDELITEYLHPTVWGHYLISQTIMTSLFVREDALGLAEGRADALDDFAGYCRRLGYGVRERVLARNDLILLLKNMPYAERPPILEQRLAHLVGEQLADLPKLSYAQIADFAHRGGVAFLAAVIADLADPQPLADALDELVGPLGLAP
jgi:lysophospholipase L1-like esterase